MTTLRKTLVAAICSAALMGSAWAQTSTAPEYAPEVGQAGKDVVWVPTPQSLVDAMLDMAELTADDYLVDLGSGDGRTVITAAKRGAKAHGIEYNPDMVNVAVKAAEAEGVSDKATFVQGDIFESDFSDATVISLFLLPNLNVKLRPIILDMAPGTRVVSNSFDMSEWQADEKVRVDDTDCTTYCRGFKWVVPAKAEGDWELDNGGTLSLTQTFQMLDGTLESDGTAATISDARLNGVDITFKADDTTYTGKVDGDTMKGQSDSGDTWSATKRS